MLELIPGTKVTVHKLDVERREMWQYPGKVITTYPNGVLLEAFFTGISKHLAGGMTLDQDDRFLERYFTDRWFNIYEIYSARDGDLKGWYCNVCRPAEVQVNSVNYIDLALDYLVFADGRRLVLDMDEFEGLQLGTVERKECMQALKELENLFSQPPRLKISEMK